MLGQLVRAIIYVFLFLTIGLPILIVAGVIVPSQIFLMSFLAREINPDGAAVRAANNRGQVATGADTKKLLEHLRYIRSTAASPDEAPRNNRTLHIAVVETSSRSNQRIAIDIAKAEKAGVVIIAEDPINWVVRNAVPMQRAKIAFETPTVFGLHNFHPGLVAGLRSSAFGASNIARPRHMLNEGSGRPLATACATLAVWSAYFGVDPQDVGIWHFKDPVAIWVSQKGLTATGGDEYMSRVLDLPCDSEQLRAYRSGNSIYIRSGR